MTISDPWLAWSLLAAASLHIAEEFAFPGGFVAWYVSYIPQIRASVTPRFLVIINGILLAVCAAIGVQGVGTRYGVAAWLTVAALLFSNAIFHVLGAIQTRRYSPGIVTGVILYLTLPIYGYAHFIATRQASAGTAIAAALMGGSYHFWMMAQHRRRARSRSSA